MGRRRMIGIVAVVALAAAMLTIAVSGSSAKGGTTLHLTANAGGQFKFNKKSLSAAKGKVTIVMVNPKSSGLKHGIGVNGHGVDKDGKIVSAGKTTSVTVTLSKAGKYTFYCPNDHHEQKGMKGTLTIH